MVTAIHARNIALLRLHRWLVDEPVQRDLPYPLLQQRPIKDLTLRTTRSFEEAAAVPLSPIPRKTFDWALQATDIRPADFHFIDIGSGVGCGLMHAARYEFQSISGIEFAREWQEQAEANMRYLRKKRAPWHNAHSPAIAMSTCWSVS